MSTDTTTTDPAQGYVDIYLLPVPEGNLDAYRSQATTFGQVAREHGALSYREFLGDDLNEGFATAQGETLAAAVVEFTSRAHRDEVMAKVLEDSRLAGMMEGEQLADMSQMRYGGFRTFVDV